jgi:hypothetical protein
VVGYCERYSNSIREVGQNGRRGALMLTLSVHHPEVLDFARMKLDPKKVTGANVSVRLSDEFLRAVKEDGEYEQRWPVDSATPTVSRKVKAREVWREIIRCAWSRAEPGLLFWDHIIRESPADCYAGHGFRTESTNPCSELPLCPTTRAASSCSTCSRSSRSARSQKDAYFDFGVLRHAKRRPAADGRHRRPGTGVRRPHHRARSRPTRSRTTSRAQRAETVGGNPRRKCEHGPPHRHRHHRPGDAMAAVGVPYGTDELHRVHGDRVYRHAEVRLLPLQRRHGEGTRAVPGLGPRDGEGRARS